MWARTRTRLARNWNQSTLFISRWMLSTCPRRLPLPQSCVSDGYSGGPMVLRQRTAPPTCLSIKRGVHLHRNTPSPSEPPAESSFIPRKVGIWSFYTKQHSISVDMHEEFQWKHFQLAALAQVKNSMSPACFHLRNPSQPLDLRYLILLSHSHFPQLFIPHCSSHVILHLPI